MILRGNVINPNKYDKTRKEVVIMTLNDVSEYHIQ